jgi:hypothetical protein
MIAVPVLLGIGSILLGPRLSLVNFCMLPPICFDIFVPIAVRFDILHARILLLLVLLFAALISLSPRRHFYNTFILIDK